MKIIKVFLAGLVLGILLAPQSGSKTRKKIGKIFTDAKDDVRDHIADAVGSVESKVHGARKSIEQL